MAVLDSGDSGWHVLGWNSGIVQIVFRQDHPTRKIWRIFRTDGHMRKRRILPWNNHNQPDLAGDRQGKYRCRRDIRVLCPWNDCVPDGDRGGKGRRKESEDEIWGRWGVLRGRGREYFVGMVRESRDRLFLFLNKNIDFNRESCFMSM